MRLIGTLPDERQAHRFGDYLLTLGITTKLMRETGTWEIWVCHEDQLASARLEWEAFRQQPDDPKYQSARSTANQIRKAKAEADRRYEARFRSAHDLWGRPAPGPVTKSLIAICVVVSLLTWFGHGDLLGLRGGPLLYKLTFTGWVKIDLTARGKEQIDKLNLPPEVKEDMLANIEHLAGMGAGMYQMELDPGGLRSGQLWRLLTPIFLHFGVLHLFFNMYALFTLGGLVESRRPWWWYLLFVAVVGVFSNVGEFAWQEVIGRDPFHRVHIFGGMSGVLYGLFGFLWVKSRFDVEPGLRIPQDLILMMFLWLFICMTGAVGPIANAAHVSGLVAGVAWAGAEWGWRRLAEARGRFPAR